MDWSIDEEEGLGPKLSPLVETLIAPPPFVLPESIRASIRGLIEFRDLHWIKRHPECERKERDQPDRDGKWGEDCPRCFSEVPAYVTIGNLEHALSLYRTLGATPAGEDFSLTVGAAAGRLKETVADLDRMVAAGWDQLFFVRDQLARELPSLLRLVQTIDEIAAAPVSETAEADGAPIPRRDLLLTRVLGEILAVGGLPCGVETVAGEERLSPGLEILKLCLDQVGLEIKPEVVIKILSTTS